MIRLYSKHPIDFAAEARSDRILVSRGAETLYLKDARWVTPAPDMLAGLARTVFAAQASEILLTTPRQAAGVDYALQLSVDRFEAVYAPAAGKKDPPVVRVEGEARDEGLAAAAQAALIDEALGEAS